MIEGSEGAGFHAGHTQHHTAIAARKLLFQILKLPIDIERQSAGHDFQPFARALPLDIAILLDDANREPAEDADRQQRRDGEEERQLAPMCPGHGGLFYEPVATMALAFCHERVRNAVGWRPVGCHGRH